MFEDPANEEISAHKVNDFIRYDFLLFSVQILCNYLVTPLAENFPPFHLLDCILTLLFHKDFFPLFGVFLLGL